MTPPRTRSALLAGFGLLAVAGMLLAGCTPAPEPTPTPTAAFASEEEAFAAAEETYRAYNDAGNDRRQGKSIPDPQDFLIGAALEGDIDGLNQLQSHGLITTGITEVTSFSGLTSQLTTKQPEVTALVCLDVSGVRLLDDDGNDVTPVDRGTTVAQEVTFVGSAEALLIAFESSAEAERC